MVTGATVLISGCFLGQSPNNLLAWLPIISQARYPMLGVPA